MENIYSQRIEALRSMMRERDWDAVVITGSDPHHSEYPAERWKQVRWLSGFTGEAGDLVITLDHAGLWTDTRYFIQANAQLEGTGIELHKTRVPEQVLIPDWLPLHFADRDELIVTVDGLCMGADAVTGIKDRLASRGIECLVVSVPDLLGRLWNDRPEIPQTPIFFADPGESRASRIAWLRSFLESRSLNGILLTALDEIAWLLNVRASDIEYNPLVISYLLVTPDSVSWYVLKQDVEDPETEQTFSVLLSQGIDILPYADIEMALSEFTGTLFVDAGTINWHLRNTLSCEVVSEDSPVQMKKAVKNAREIAGMRRAHLYDGIAVEKFLYWVEKSVQAQRGITEWDAALKLQEFRSEIPGYRGDSFETISAYGKGAALPHYVTPRSGAPVLFEEGLYLCDSGGQYDYGTTDITRTIPLGRCSALEKEDYTLVLKCHIDLAMAVYPEGTPGCRLDILAREPLWRAKRNFGHGTGHGVGYFLGVHEGPHEFRQNFNDVPFTPGMVVTNEPGIYREGRHGVRHENLMLMVPAGENEFGRWMAFEPLTLCHFDTSVIVRELMTADEIKWLNAYNARVYETLREHLPRPVAEWLKEKTAAI